MVGLLRKMINNEPHFYIRYRVNEVNGIKEGTLDGIFPSLTKALLPGVSWQPAFTENGNQVMWTTPESDGSYWYSIERVDADSEEEALSKVEDQELWKLTPMNK